MAGCALDLNGNTDANKKWWCPAHGSEKDNHKADIHHRVEEVQKILSSTYQTNKIAILSGHSQYFENTFKEFVHPDIYEKSLEREEYLNGAAPAAPKICSYDVDAKKFTYNKLFKKKLMNGVAARVTFDFAQNAIVYVRLLNGGGNNM